MGKYCVSCKKNTANKNSIVRRSKQKRLMLATNCTNCGKEKPRFIQNKEASGLLGKLRIRTPLNNFPFIYDTLF